MQQMLCRHNDERRWHALRRGTDKIHSPAVAHFYQMLLALRDGDGMVLNQSGVDINRSHIVDKDSNLESVVVGENVPEQGRLACSEKSTQEGDGQFAGSTIDLV